MLVRISSPFGRSINFLKRNFNKTILVATSLEHRNMNLLKNTMFHHLSLSVTGNNNSNNLPILFRTPRKLYLTPGLKGGLFPLHSKNYSSQPKFEDKALSENVLFGIRKVSDMAKAYKDKSLENNNLNRRKLLELYGFALNLTRKFATTKPKSLELEVVEIIKVFLWEELRIKQDVTVVNLAQSMNLFKAKLKNTRLVFNTREVAGLPIYELAKKSSRAYEELLQWMFEHVKELLGPPPCRFSIVSLGSLARGMASPYSDTEYFILVESSVQKHQVYFRNFADVFDFLMIGFGESPIYEASDLLNSDSTLAEIYKRFKEGMRVDQHKRPQDFNRLFGLITTGKELVEALPKEAIHQAGNHLTSALFATKYLWGDKILYQEYQKLFTVTLETREYLSCFQKLLRQDINAAKAERLLLENRLLEKSQESFELKSLLTVAIQLAESLAILLKIKGEKLVLKAHPFEVLNQLRGGNYITDTQHESWQNAMQILFELRFRLQQENQSTEASISLQSLEKAIPISKLCSGLETMIEVVETQLNQSSRFKPLPSIQDVLQSEAKVLGDVPRQDNIFVPRRALLKSLEKKLKVNEKEKNASTKMVVCVGLGGVGKTQFLLNYFRNPKHPYAYKAWFRADNIVTLEQSYRAMAKAWGFWDEKAAIKDVIQYVKRHLNEHPGWLFVYDNANSYEEISPFLPEGGGTVIISTRHQYWPTGTFERLPIPVMGLREALNMIEALSGRKIEEERKDAEELTKVLGYLPLALAQASAYMKETTTVTARTYLELYKKNEAELLAEDTLPQVDKEVRSLPIAITWSVTLEAILEKEKNSATPTLALELLTVCAYLAPDRIPLYYLLAWLKLAYPNLKNPELQLNHCLRTLVQYSLMDFQEKAFVGVHRLVQTVLREQQQNTSLKKKFLCSELTVEWYEILLTAGTRELNRESEILVNERKTIELLTHLQHLIEHYDKIWSMRTPPPVIAWVLGNIGEGLWTLANPRSAKPYFERAVKILESYYGKEHWQVGRTLSDLGTAFRILGESKRAKELLTRALRILEIHYGKEHWKVATTLSNLGITLNNLGEAEQAKALLTSALKIEEDHYGKDHWIVGRTLNNLGNIFHDLKKFESAKTLYERALKIQENYYGKEHWQVARTLSNLGLVYRDLGKIDVAQELLTKALKTLEVHYGDENWVVATTLGSLALTLHDLRKTQEAKILLERALRIQESYFGHEYWAVARTLNNLGTVLRDLGELHQAKIILERALKIQEAHYGKEHFVMATTLNNLGLAFRDLGEVETAKKLWIRALMIFRKHYPENHCSIQAVLRDLKKLGIESPFDSVGTKPSNQVSAPSLVPQFQTTRQVNTNSHQKALLLCKAVEEGNEEVVKQLLENPQRLDINAVEPQSIRTALHIAVLNRRKNIVTLLIQAGARQDIPDKQGKTAATYALESSDQEVIALLQAKKLLSQPKK